MTLNSRKSKDGRIKFRDLEVLNLDDQFPEI
jgi:hypothetical protein